MAGPPAKCDADIERQRYIAVCTDWLGACLALADAAEGDTHFFAPGEGKGWRRYLAGGDAPWDVPMRREPESVVVGIARRQHTTRAAARASVHAELAAAAGVGGEHFRFFRDRGLDPWRIKWAKRYGLTTEAPMR